MVEIRVMKFGSIFMQLKKSVLAGICIGIMFVFFTSCTSAQSRTAINMQAGSGYEKADKELNLVYKQILKEYAAQPLFINKLKITQRLWVQLRDAELGARFPETDKYGSVQPTCEAGYLEQLTRERIKFLKVWLNGIPEGDVCSGSVKIK
ncbi:uncharacterized protein YecT (DUF1311 family) [Pedobacter psychrotolerans]|uniref:Uncharacterized protein YecT (DUF1311 family) n=1 Tax=Pedobacter psychrotolerans TaxID=1843235 RepID=A0A4R2HC81_9SPHI|nr:lysozyme inhibitor LprI family protein [Pedobacter psychrotolerans]TCO25338.1 uncharacterized protein YecT (DUF1311 family) [Pedobacter psychrotolerans]GGE46332.1 hypothetical protein GCM10011413_10470 [Pedobacter psychrotolerans]